MKHLKTITLTAFACIILACACEEPEPPLTELPPITQEGANTFGCYVNDNLFVPNDKWQNRALQIPNPKVYFADSLLQVTAKGLINPNDEDDGFYNINITIYDFDGVGTYSLEKNNISVSLHVTDSCMYSDRRLDGIIEISTLDTQTNFVSGIFNFEMGIIPGYRKYNCDTLINITEGRFDIKTK